MYIKSILLCVLALFIFSSCDPDEALNPTNKCIWVVKNNTGEDIWIKSGLSSNASDKCLKVNELYTFRRVGVSKGENIDFQDLFIAYIHSNDPLYQTLEIYNNDKTTLLKKWTVSELTNSGRQFFNEAYWSKKEWKGQGDDYSEKWYNYYEWTFEILPEDIASK
jgi:hypothetical protein